MIKKFILVIGFILAAAVAQAQTPVVGPTTLTFTASADQTTVVSGTSTPVLTNYSVNVMSGANTVLSVSIGKPTPDGTNTITVANSAITGWGTLSKNVVFTATISAVGPGGTATSTASNPFVLAVAPAAPAAVREQ